jgi:Cu+-exporting ATPase
MKPIALAIDGMHCQGCVQRVQAALQKVPGVLIEKVELGKARLQIPEGREPAILAALDNIGFDAHIAKTE